MNNISAARWTAVGLHVIVLLYGAVIGVATMGIDPIAIVRHANADPGYRQVALLTVLIVAGNLIGALLLLSKLYRTFTGLCWIFGYELVLLSASLLFLGLEYAIVIGAIVLAVLSVLVVRRRTSEMQVS